MSTVSDKAFAALYDTYYERLQGFIRARIGDAWLAEDLAQEAFLQARRHFGALRDHGKFKPWLFRIAYNICRDYHRAANGRPESVPPSDGEIGAPHPHLAENWLEQQEMGTCVQKHILMLPNSYRTVLWLYDVLGFTHKEIADVLDIDAGNVKVRLHRARKKMRAILEANCCFERDERNIFVCVPKGCG